MKLINDQLAIEPEQFKDLNQGFPKITKTAISYYNASS